MTIAYFVTFEDPKSGTLRLSAVDCARVVDIVGRTPSLEQGLVYTPETTRDPYSNDGPSPALAFELYFADLPQLEAALAPGGHLHALAETGALPSLAGASVTQQAMLVRTFPVPQPAFQTPPGASPCTYLVHYAGEAEDLNAWLWYYIENHPRVMARFPGIRQIEICTRVDWCGFLPWRRVDYMQRNKVVFDSPAALTAALNSPVREEMRADFGNFPPFTGPTAHFPMATRAVVPARVSG